MHSKTKKLTFLLLTVLVVTAVAAAAAAQAAPLKGVTAVSAAVGHTCAIAKKRLYCWGQNYGQFGDGTVTSSKRPIRVWSVGSDVRNVAAAEGATCAATGKALKCWGDINGGNLTSLLPTTVAGARLPVASIALGKDSDANGPMQLCAIFRASLSCGDLGLPHHLEPVADLGGEPSMSSIGAATCAVVSGAAKCWGNGYGGMLGNGSEGFAETPTAVTGLGQGVSRVSVGSSEACAIVNAAVKCWGVLYGAERTQLGVPRSNVPVDVPTLTSGVTDVAVAGGRACAIVNGGVACWGWGVKEEAGNDLDAGSSWTPVSVPGLESGVTALSAGGGHLCAIASGLLKCWGANPFGELGTGGTKSGLNPQTVVAPGPTIHAKLRKRVAASLGADYGGGVYVGASYSIPKHIQAKGACDARITFAVSGDGISTRKASTRFIRRGAGCSASWRFPSPSGEPPEVEVTARSRGNWLLRPTVLKTTAVYCEGRGCP